MKAKITYIIHSCFTVEFDDKVLLFDYPGRGFSTEDTKKIVRSILDGKAAYIFASHSHGDHFTTDIFNFEEGPSRTHFVLSDDISLYRGSRPLNLTMIGAEEKVVIDDISIESFKSNDAGVAFLITYKDKKIYYGGDLAKWDWPEWSSSKRKKHVDVFKRILYTLKDIDIAFSNMDKRLDSWAGPLEFINQVDPKYFVPMHTFGNEDWIEDLLAEDIPHSTTVFHYKKTGDSTKWNL